MEKDWRSKKEFEEYLMEKQRWEVIGYVTQKTLKKWGEEIIWGGWESDENLYILQNGNKYFYLFNRAISSSIYI